MILKGYNMQWGLPIRKQDWIILLFLSVLLFSTHVVEGQVINVTSNEEIYKIDDVADLFLDELIHLLRILARKA